MAIKMVIMFGEDDFPEDIRKVMRRAGYKTGEAHFLVLDGTLEKRRTLARWAGMPLPTK